MAITKLTSEQLYRKCDAAKFDFTTTADLEERLSALGQDRAICAVELGINIKSRGYNLFCLGPEGTGKTSLVKRILEKEGKQRPTPDDWAYVYNFDEPHKPIAVNFPAGAAAGFAKDMEEFAYAMEHDLPEAVKNELYEEQLSVIREKYQEKRNDYVKVLQKKAKGKKVSLLHMPMGVVVAPMKNGEIISPDVFDTLSDDEKNEIMADLNAMQEEIAQHQDDAPGWEEKQTEEIKKLQEKLVKDAIKKPINDIKQKYRGNKKVAEYLKAVQNYILENIPSFVPNYDQDSKPQTEEEPMAGLLSQLKNQQEEDKYSKFKVNVVVKNVPDSGAPIVLLDHPPQGNLVGQVERIQQFGALLTDFTLIKGGALHRANGGFLLIDARKLLLQPYSWDSLKRALASKEIKIEAPSEDTSFSTISLDPQPIPLDVKVVMTGDAELYDLLSERDPDFSDYFMVEADFGMIIDRTDENEVEYAKLIGSLTNKKNLRSLNKQAVARVIEYSSRLADDSEKLTAHVSSIGDLLKEADYWARKSKASQIGKNHVDQAIKSQIYRSDRVNRAMLEQIDKGTILLDVKGERVGQINGLVVYNFTRNSFGKPTRITTQVRLGRGEKPETWLCAVCDRQADFYAEGAIPGWLRAGYVQVRVAVHTPPDTPWRVRFALGVGAHEDDAFAAAQRALVLPPEAAAALPGTLAAQYGMTDAELAGAMAHISPLLFATAAPDASAQQLERPALWAHGISGDLPVWCARPEAHVLRQWALLRALGIGRDLALCTSDGGDDLQPTRT